MDLAISLIAGVAIRLVFKSPTFAHARSFSSAFVGVSDGVIFHQCSSRAGNELEHFLTLGLRVAVDHILWRNPSITVITLVWAALGYIISEVITPGSSLRPRYSDRRERQRRHRSTRSVPSRARTQQSSGLTTDSLAQTLTTPPPPAIPRLARIRSTTTAVAPVHRPASPPSFFLHDNDAESVPTEIHPLALSPSQTVAIEDNSLVSRSSPRLPPTPPKSTPSENVADGINGKANRTRTPNRLSTIDEISSAAEGASVSRPEEATLKLEETSPILQDQAQSSNPSQNTTRAGTPLPVPNSTIFNFPPSDSFNPAEDIGGDNEVRHSTPYSQANLSGSPPVPVPNSTTANWQFRGSQDGQPDLLSPLSDGPVFNPITRREKQELLSPLSDRLSLRDELVSRRHAPSPRREPSPQRPASDSSELVSSISDGPDFDELRTPPQALGRRSRGATSHRITEISDDPLRTPPGLTPRSFSPLSLDEPLPSSSARPRSGVPKMEFQPFAAIDTGFDIDLEPMSIPGSMPPADALLPSEESRQPTSLSSDDPNSDRETVRSGHSDATSVFSTTNPTKLADRADQLRNDARQREAQYRELKNEYHKAIREVRPRDALIIKGEIQQLEEEAARLHKKSERRHFAARNDFNPRAAPNTIDVHGLRPSEALERTEKALRELLKDGTGHTLSVIVGKGLHSVGRQPVLKPVIAAAMDRQNIPWRVDAKNSGILIITLPT